MLKIDTEQLNILSDAGIRRDKESYEQVYFYPPTMSFTQYDQTLEPNADKWKGLGRETCLYVHVPFCTGHCTYCHYVTYAGAPSQNTKEYILALRQEIGLLADRNCFDSRTGEVIHVGGGTPTYLEHDEILELCCLIRETIPINPGAEYTWEASPETIVNNGREKLCLLLKEGVNRLSIGIESLEDHILKACGRRHSTDIAVQSFYEARASGFANINIDTIYCLADQTLDDWKRTLDAMVALEPDCITAYHLRKKKGTPMASLSQKRFPSEETCRQMQIETITRLTGAGYIQVLGNQFVRNLAKTYRYEVEKYKDERDIIGLGVSSYSYINGWAYYNCRSLVEYFKAVGNDQLPIILERKLNTSQRAARMVVLGLRRVHDGMSKDIFKHKFGFPVEKLYGETIQRLESLGLIHHTPHSIRLTDLGTLFSDEVCIEFYAQEEKEQLRKSNASKYGLYLPYPAHLDKSLRLSHNDEAVAKEQVGPVVDL